MDSLSFEVILLYLFSLKNLKVETSQFHVVVGKKVMDCHFAFDWAGNLG